MKISGIKAISIFDDNSGSATEGVVVQRNRIVNNQGEGLINNGLSEEDSAGLDVWAGDESIFEFGSFDTAGDDQLDTWQRDEQEVKLVTAGTQDNLLWYQPATIKVHKPFSFATGNRNYHRITIRKKGGAHAIGAGINLFDVAVKLKGFDTGWQDTDSDDQADGYTLNGLTAVSFVNGVQTLSDDIAGSMFIDLVYPIANIDLINSVNLTEAHSTGNEKSRLKTFDFGNVELQINDIGAAGVGIFSSSLKTASNTWKVEAQIIALQGGTGVDNFSIKDPALRTDGSTEYIAG